MFIRVFVNFCELYLNRLLYYTNLKNNDNREKQNMYFYSDLLLWILFCTKPNTCSNHTILLPVVTLTSN